jgi:hypothetical protein
MASWASADQAGNRLNYLDEPANPYYVGPATARLSTPQWIGEEGVEAVIVFAIDDMADAARYESFLRPILDRLKQIDGRAPLSIMTKSIDPQSPQLPTWFAEGVSVECHTQDHPCPCLQGGKIENTKSTFDRCVDQLSAVPGNHPVAFRMPCCDSMNSVSPRFFTEIFSRTTPGGRFLSMDSSVMLLFTAHDEQLPPELIVDETGQERFRKYIPTDRLMVNYVEDYPYPYVIDHSCWEIPALMPSDWDAQHLNGKCSPKSLRDYEVAVDILVRKQGIFSICFHPHGWIDAQQIVSLIDYAVAKHGSKVKFLSFLDVQRRLDAHLLAQQPLRAADGRDNGVRVCDVNHDGYMDVVIANQDTCQTRVWSPAAGQWKTTGFPVVLADRSADPAARSTADRWGVLRADGAASVLVRSDVADGLWHYDGQDWMKDDKGTRSLDHQGSVFTQQAGRDCGVRLRDVDRDGTCELIVANPNRSAVYQWTENGWAIASFALPENIVIVDAQGRDAGLRWVDLDEDGDLDIVFSDSRRAAAHLFTSIKAGWSRVLFDAPRQGQASELPPIVRADGSNNGAWFSHRHMWVQNEDTGKVEPEHLLQRSFDRDFHVPGNPNSGE